MSTVQARRGQACIPPILPAENHHDADVHDHIPPSSADGKRKAGRVFSEEEEIEILMSFSKAAKNSVSSSPSRGIDPPTFEKMVRSLGHKFTRGQLSDKLRRLRDKYRKQSRSKSRIVTPHDRQIFEISSKIWGKDKAGPAREPEEGPSELQNHVQGPLGEEKEGEATFGEQQEQDGNEGSGGVDDFGKFPVLAEECERALEGNGVWRQVLKAVPEPKLRALNEKLLMLKYEEAALMAKKAETAQELTRMILGAFAASFAAPKAAS